MERIMIDQFTGIWVMDASENQYEHGTAPQSGRYVIDANDDGSYHFHLDWETVDCQAMHIEFDAIPDGILYPYDNLLVADSVSLTPVDDHTLDSQTVKEGQVIIHARRVLSPDGKTMQVFQSGPLPQGGTFTNRSLYRRVM
jgi:hypothetical protein